MTNITGDITALIPQRPPFVMIDRLTGHDDRITRSGFLIKKDNIFIEDGKMAAAGLVENIAQTAAAKAGYTAGLENRPVQVGYIGAIKNLVIYLLPDVGDELETEIFVVHQIFDVSIIKGKISSNNVLLAECEMKIFISQLK